MIPIVKIWLFETERLDPYFIGEKDGVTVTLQDGDNIDFLNIKTVTYFMNSIVNGTFIEEFSYGGEDGGIADSTGKNEKSYELQFNMPIENRDNLNRFAGSQYSLLGQRVDGSRFVVFGQFEADDLTVDNRIQNRMTLRTETTSARLFEVNSFNIETVLHIIDDVVTPAPPAIPSIPTGFNIVANGENQIDVGWLAQDGVDNFIIEYGTDGFTFPNSESVAGDQTSFSITGLSIGTLYYVRMKAVNESGESGFTTILSVSTEANLNFTFSINTLATDTFTFPQRSDTAFTGSIEWETGVIENFVSTSGDIFHDYGTAYIGDINVLGTNCSPAFNNSGDKLKMRTVSNWGGCIINSEASFTAFSGCTDFDFTATDSPTIVNMLQTFMNCVNMVGNSNINNWDISAANTLQDCFSGADNFNQPLGSWDTSNVTKFINTFFGADIFNQDLSAWDASSVASASQMFNGATAFNSPVFQITSVCTDLLGTFANCPNFNQDVSNFDTSNVGNFLNMFINDGAFDQSIGDFDLSSATNISGIIKNTGLSSANYNDCLIKWEAQAPPVGLTLGADSLVATGAGLTARTSLMTTYSWTIVDATP